MERFACLFVVFATFIIAFGFGFYVIFNDQPNDKKVGNWTTLHLEGNDTHESNGTTSQLISNDTHNEKGPINYFSYPYLAIIKTSAMMIGELVSKCLKINRIRGVNSKYFCESMFKHMATTNTL